MPQPGTDEQVVVRVDLSQPGILRIPRVVHRHGTLRYRIQREFPGIDQLRLQCFVIEQQRIEVIEGVAPVNGRLWPILGGTDRSATERAAT